MESVGEQALLPRVIAASALMVAASAAGAGCPSTFEGGNLGDWLFATTGVYGSSGVELHNGSQMAFVNHVGGHGNNYGHSTTSSSLSCTLNYSAGETLSFDIHAVALIGTGFGGPAHSGSGVRVDFLNAFNVALGSVGFYNYTDPGMLGPHEFPISNTQLHFEALMSDYAELGDVSPSAPKKISLTYLAWAQFVGGGNIYPNVVGSASVYFDDVAVGAVPEPSTSVLMLGGVGLLGWLRRRVPRALVA